MYIYIHTYVYIFIYIYSYKHIYIYTCRYIHSYTYVCSYIYIYIHMYCIHIYITYTCIYVHIHYCIQIYRLILMYTCTYTLACTYISTYTYIFIYIIYINTCYTLTPPAWPYTAMQALAHSATHTHQLDTHIHTYHAQHTHCTNTIAQTHAYNIHITSPALTYLTHGKAGQNTGQYYQYQGTLASNVLCTSTSFSIHDQN